MIFRLNSRKIYWPSAIFFASTVQMWLPFDLLFLPSGLNLEIKGDVQRYGLIFLTGSVSSRTPRRCSCDRDNDDTVSCIL